MVYTVVYTPNCYRGAIGEVRRVSELEIGKPYLIHDLHAERHAYRGEISGLVKGSRTADKLAPSFTWTLEESDQDGRYYIKNLATGNYVQRVLRSQTAKTGETPYAFTPTYDESTQSWKIKNGSNSLCWDGVESLDLVGWDSPGHPYAFCEFNPAPYFAITIEERYQSGELISSTTKFVAPGTSYLFTAASRPGKELISVEGAENMDEINSNKLITVIYSNGQDGIEEILTNQTHANKGIYDLTGRRLPKISRPGIYIINGTKTVIK